MGPEVANLIAGLSDAEIDVWALFERDAHGLTGLFPGQLVTELLEAHATLLPRVVEAIRRGLTSADGRDQQAALHGAAALRSEVDLTTELAALLDAVPAIGGTAEFIDLVARQPIAAPATERLVDRLAGLRLEDGARDALARLLVRQRPAAVREGLVAALGQPLSPDALAMQRACLRALSPVGVNAVADTLAGESVDVRNRASQFFYEVLGGNTDPGRYDRWMALHTRLLLSLDGVPARPYESPEAAERRRQLVERLAAMTTAAPAPPTKAPEAVVLATPVWLDALRIPEGPPVALFDLLRRHHVTILRSEVLLDEVEVALRQLNWAADAIGSARDRIIEATVTGDPKSDVVALAKAAGLDVVYSVGPSTGQQRDDVTVRPVHELLTLLERAPIA